MAATETGVEKELGGRLHGRRGRLRLQVVEEGADHGDVVAPHLRRGKPVADSWSDSGPFLFKLGPYFVSRRPRDVCEGHEEQKRQEGFPQPASPSQAWVPDTAKVREKMKYSGTKEAVKSALTGIAINLNIHESVAPGAGLPVLTC